MTIIALNVLSEQSNHGVVQMPERQFPGAVIQGDSLAILCEEAREISERLKALSNPDDDILFLAQEHQEKLLSRLLHYQKVLAEYKMSLPYTRAAEASDLVILVHGGDDSAL
jgi:hypothetical protein